VKDGYTLDGKGFTITAVDGDSGSFNGAVVQNDGATMYVKNIKINGGATTAPENCDRVFNGVAFMAASGSIKGVTLTNIGRPADTGCQLGRAILVDAFGSSIQRSVSIEGNVVSAYNKNGIDVRGNVDATILGNTVTGSSSSLVARNGIVVRTDVAHFPNDVAVAQVGGNKVSGNYYTGPADTYATGLLVIDATVSIDRKNTVSGNQKDIDNAGTIDGKFKPSA